MKNIPTGIKVIGAIVLGFGLLFVYHTLTSGSEVTNQTEAFDTQIPVSDIDIEADRQRYSGINKTELVETVEERANAEKRRQERLDNMESKDLAKLYDDPGFSSSDPFSGIDDTGKVKTPVKVTEKAEPVQSKNNVDRKPVKKDIAAASTSGRSGSISGDASYFYTITATNSTTQAVQNSASTQVDNSTSSQLPNPPVNIRGTIYGDYDLRSGDKVKIRLLEDLPVKGGFIPANTIVYGIASQGNQRMLVKVHRVEINRESYVVNLSLYDTDGLEGLYVPINDVNEGINQTGQGIAEGVAGTLTNGMYGIDQAVSGISELSRRQNYKVYVADGFSVTIRN
ncbi:MAG: conjugative transposon protein TraM [Cyclobacteriaceae bacterium]